MKIEAKKDLRRLITVVLASLLMAINIKTFVRTGDSIRVVRRD